MTHELHLSDLWAVVIGLGSFLVLVNLHGIYEILAPIIRQGIRHYIVLHITSSDAGDAAIEEVVAPPVVNDLKEAGQLIAITDNEVNNELSDNAVVQPVLPDEVRDIIRMHAKAEALAVLIKAGIVTNKAAGIEKVFICSRSSREDSMYQKALKALDPLLDSGPKFPPITPEQEALREELELR